MLIDSHCHLDFPDFDDCLPQIIANAETAGIDVMLTISTRIRQIDRIRRIIEKYPSIYGSVGTHPHNAEEEADIEAEEIAALAQHEKIIAIGEAGLDYHYDNAAPALQAQGLKRHIEAARISALPLIIHAREADADMIKILTEEMNKGAFSAVLHCFSSSCELAKAGIALGFYVSFSGILTFKRSDELRQIASELPLDRLLVETDSPYLAPTPFRGKRNEPALTVHVNQVLADLHGLTSQEMARQTSSNFYRLFTKCDEKVSAMAGSKG